MPDKRKKQLYTAYLEPNSDYMQKPIGGLPVLALFSTKNSCSHAKVQSAKSGRGVEATENVESLLSHLQPIYKGL